MDRDSAGQFDPICLLFVAKGTKDQGDRMLFRFPFMEDGCDSPSRWSHTRNPFSMVLVDEDTLARTRFPIQETCISMDGKLIGISDEQLAFLFTNVKPKMCEKRFEMKISDVRFVGHPVLIHKPDSPPRQPNSPGPEILLFQLVFVIRASAPESVTKCYYDISRQVAMGLAHEEKRCEYLKQQAKLMIDAHEEVQEMPEDSIESPYQLMLGKSQLARDLRTLYQDICRKGIVHLNINRWIQLSYCLPHKAHLNTALPITEQEKIDSCLAVLRPYHAIVLLQSVAKILNNLPLDASPALVRFLKFTSPLKSLRDLALDTDLPLSQIFQLVGHLVHWGKATIIYPLAESNVYSISPNAKLKSDLLVESFYEKFPSENLYQILAKFNIPISLAEFMRLAALDTKDHEERIQIVVWLLKHRLLMQLHTYIYLRVYDNMSNSGLDMRRRSSPDDVIGTDKKQSPSRSLIDKETDMNLSRYLTKTEYRSIIKTAEGVEPDALKQFARLAHYFRGQHHIEEIMYSENLKRSQVLTLLDKLKSVLITCLHEDALTAVFINS